MPEARVMQIWEQTKDVLTLAGVRYCLAMDRSERFLWRTVEHERQRQARGAGGE